MTIFFQAEDGIRDFCLSRGLGDVYKRQHDYNTERSLVLLVGKRRSLLDYLKKKDINRYREIIKELGIRK